MNERNSDHSNRDASNRVLPFSIEVILSAPHPSPLSRLEDFVRKKLPEDISGTENAERGMIKTQLLFKALSRKLLVRSSSP